MSYHYIRLNETEKKQLAYELSKENIPPILLSLKKSFNDTYQFILNIFKKIFSSKKNNNQINNELSTFVEELEKIEMNVLKQYKIMMFYVEIMDLDINGSQISLEVENEEEKDEILRLLSEREFLLKKFKENVISLERLKIKVNDIYERMTSVMDMDNTE